MNPSQPVHAHRGPHPSEPPSRAETRFHSGTKLALFAFAVCLNLGTLACESRHYAIVTTETRSDEGAIDSTNSPGDSPEGPATTSTPEVQSSGETTGATTGTKESPSESGPTSSTSSELSESSAWQTVTDEPSDNSGWQTVTDEPSDNSGWQTVTDEASGSGWGMG